METELLVLLSLMRSGNKPYTLKELAELTESYPATVLRRLKKLETLGHEFLRGRVRVGVRGPASETWRLK
jgi:DNA-binding MarR family transcriptional regulator